MRVLHICSYYIGNKLYKNMVKKLTTKNIDQTVYIPVRSKAHLGKNILPESFTTVDYKYRNILSKFDRIFFKGKINKQKRDIEKNVINKKLPEVIHAHTVFSDGGTAYLLNREYGIKYILNVRNTDINYYYKYAIHLRPFMYKILSNAESIVFISHAYKHKMLSLLPSHISKKIKRKIHVIPNGIDDYWHENAGAKGSFKQAKEINLLFVGTINENKNLYSVLLACERLLIKGFKVTLHVIGNGPKLEEAKKLCADLKMQSNVNFHGYIGDKTRLLYMYKDSDIFIMPSFKETFGLVYIEAMSQGLPVIYSKNQGIDGYFIDGKVGYSVDPNDFKSIVLAVEKIVLNYDDISYKCYLESKKFNWEKISSSYFNIYL